MNKPKRLKLVSELPPWYLKADYLQAEKLDALGWYYQFQARVFIYHTLVWEETEEEAKASGLPTHKRWLLSRALMAELKNRPVFDKNEPEFIDKFIGHESLLNPPSEGIALPSLEDIWSYMSTATQLEKMALAENLEKNTANPNLISTSPIGSFSTAYPDLLLRIDLGVPVTELTRAFEQLVTNLKRANSSPDIEQQRYKELKFSEWVRVGILPYLDLKAWEIEEKITIPLPIMAQAIFKDTDKDISAENEETLRKTTEKLANRIFHGNLLKILSTKVYADEFSKTA